LDHTAGRPGAPSEPVAASSGRKRTSAQDARRSRLLAAIEAGRRHPLRVLLVTIAAEVSLLAIIGSVSDARDVFGLPGSVAALLAVVAGALAGPPAGALTALAGGGIFYWLVADLGTKSTPQTTALSTALWLAAGVISGLLAGALREREARRTEAAVRLAESQAAHAAEVEVAALHAALENGLLPAGPPHHDKLRIVTAYRPGEQRLRLGGDFLDVLPLPDGELALIIGDVMGHGPQAAALGARLRAAWQGLTLGGAHLVTVADSLNRLVRLSNPEGLATACLVHLDRLAENASFLSAGHPLPLLLAGGVAAIELPPNLPFGAQVGWRYVGQQVELPPRWALFLYTDGLIEGRRSHDGRSPDGEEQLKADLRRLRTLTQAAVSRLVADAERANGGGLEDDVAVVAVSRREPGGP
jgi:serine phosphatase RsbU (regulator of sigma subunit)